VVRSGIFNFNKDNVAVKLFSAEKHGVWGCGWWAKGRAYSSTNHRGVLCPHGDDRG